MAAIEAASVPHMTAQGRAATIERWQRAAKNEPKAKAPMLIELLLGSRGVKVRRIEAPKAVK
jgi:hypothetical protein